MIHETVQDQEEEEHLPDSLPESEDMEEEENTAAAEEEAIIDNGQQEQNLPEQSTNQPGQNTTNQQPEQTQPGDQEQDVMGRMPGQLPNQTEAAPTDYANVKRLAKEKIRGLLGTEVTCKSGNKVVKWKVIVNWRQKVELFNAAYKKSGTKGRLFTRQEFLVALGLLIAAAEFSHNGKDLFKRGDQKNRLQR